jgi:hypothetical protein
MLQRYAAVPTVDAIDQEATRGWRFSDESMLCLVRSPVQPASVSTSSIIPITRMLGSPDYADDVCRWCYALDDLVVAGDAMLAQKIALETYESGALGLANRLPIIRPC